jgi:hypothetical protein
MVVQYERLCYSSKRITKSFANKPKLRYLETTQHNYALIALTIFPPESSHIRYGMQSNPIGYHILQGIILKHQPLWMVYKHLNFIAATSKYAGKLI